MQRSVIDRDGCCTWCGRVDETLIGHHMATFGSSGDDTEENLVTLCGYCHGCVGNGYLDSRVCNEPWILADRRQVVGAVSVGGSDWKMWEPDELLRKIYDKHYAELPV